MYGVPDPTQIGTTSEIVSNVVNNPTASMSPMSLLDQFKGWAGDSGFLKTKNADGTETGGWGGLALGAVSGIANAYMGMQQYGLAKDQLAFQKDSFNKNYAAQRQSMNTQLEDRQRARVASNSGAYQSVGDYMNQNRIA